MTMAWSFNANSFYRNGRLNVRDSYSSLDSKKDDLRYKYLHKTPDEL